jgi:2-amino-4-hydroxy-6-hydroxymethyldihydropteridine diphosphokinase
MAGIYLSLGSNIGDRARNIARALELLAARGVRVVKQSALYETEPVEMRAQDWFLNGVVEVETETRGREGLGGSGELAPQHLARQHLTPQHLAPQQLMQALLEIERSMGRERVTPKGPRIIDMDILLYGSAVVREAQLEIPHPRMAERRFVLVPFAEIAPEAVHPVLKKTIRELLSETRDRSEVRRVEDERKE